MWSKFFFSCLVQKSRFSDFLGNEPKKYYLSWDDNGIEFLKWKREKKVGKKRVMGGWRWGGIWNLIQAKCGKLLNYWLEGTGEVLQDEGWHFWLRKSFNSLKGVEELWKIEELLFHGWGKANRLDYPKFYQNGQVWKIAKLVEGG